MEALATTYRYGGRVGDAVALHEETLKLMKAKLGVDHRLTLRCMVNLGMDYVSANRAADAVALHEETLRLSRRGEVRNILARSSPCACSRFPARRPGRLNEPLRCMKSRTT